MTSQRPTEIPVSFAQNYQRLLKRLKLRGMQPKTIESYSHGVRRAGAHFEYQIDNLSRDQLSDYFAQVLDQLSWSTLKCDLYGLKFYYAYVRDKPWPGAELTKAPKVSRLPDVRFSLDDFGTGNSSLLYLKRLPLDQLKIDQ